MILLNVWTPGKNIKNNLGHKGIYIIVIKKAVSLILIIFWHDLKRNLIKYR